MCERGRAPDRVRVDLCDSHAAAVAGFARQKIPNRIRLSTVRDRSGFEWLKQSRARLVDPGSCAHPADRFGPEPGSFFSTPSARPRRGGGRGDAHRALAGCRGRGVCGATHPQRVATAERVASGTGRATPGAGTGWCAGGGIGAGRSPGYRVGAARCFSRAWDLPLARDFWASRDVGWRAGLRDGLVRHAAVSRPSGMS